MADEGTPQRVPIRGGVSASNFGLRFECVATTGGFPLILVSSPPAGATAADCCPTAAPTAEKAAQSKLGLLAPVLRRALAEAQRRAERHQREIEREKRMERLSHTLHEVKTLTDLLPLCWSFSV